MVLDALVGLLAFLLIFVLLAGIVGKILFRG
jgi:hypothetical protein